MFDPIRVISLLMGILVHCVCMVGVLKAQPGPRKGVRELTVVDEDGNAIVGVSVRLVSLHFEEFPSSWTSLSRQPIEICDEEGQVRFPYPMTFTSSRGLGTTKVMGLMLEHPQYVSQRFNIDLQKGKSKHTLEKGCRLSFSAIDSQRELVSDFSVVMSGPAMSVKWLAENGSTAKYSTAIPDGSWQAMLVSPRRDGRHLFSQVMPVRLADDQEVRVRKLLMKQGIRLTGILSENVPRPIRDGRVTASCVPRSIEQRGGNDAAPLGWRDVAIVNEDGTFEFESLPSSGTTQIIASCDGWFGASDAGSKNFITGKTVDVRELAGLADPQLVIAMEQTGVLEVAVRNENDEPMPDVFVAAHPQRKSPWASFFQNSFGQRSVDAIWKQLDETYVPLLIQWPHRTGFRGTTDENGLVTLRGLPVAHWISVYGKLDGYSITNPAIPVNDLSMGRLNSAVGTKWDLVAVPSKKNENSAE